MGISSFLSVPDKAAKRFRPAIRRSAWTRLALVGALFTASHARANETRQVVSSNGTTNTVERIDFPVGDIKDIIPAGDKYIIHANPIDSLKGGVAVDALFVMEKDQNDRAFGRTFSDEITSVAYVPGLDIAVWSYTDGDNYTTSLMENKRTSLETAGSIKEAVVEDPDDIQDKIYPKSHLFPVSTNKLWELGIRSHRHLISHENETYVITSDSGDNTLGVSDKVFAPTSQGVFMMRESNPTRLSLYSAASIKHHTIPNMGYPTSMAAIQVNQDENEGKVLLGYETGAVRSSDYTAQTISGFGDPQTVLNGAVNSMAATTNQTVKVVSTNSNVVVEITPSLGVEDTIIPNTSESGYRKVITDGNDTLLLSNTHSNYFYRVRKTR